MRKKNINNLILIIIIIIVITLVLLYKNIENFQSFNPKNTDFDIFIIAGQSNAVGRGTRNIDKYKNIKGQVSIFDSTDNDIYQLDINNSTIKLATHRIDNFEPYPPAYCHNTTCDTVGFGLSFAKMYKKYNQLASGRKILLVGCAYGSTGFMDQEGNGASNDNNKWWWNDVNYPESGYINTYSLYNRTIERLQKLKPLIGSNSKVRAILWHQGENDKNKDKTEYKIRCKRILTKIRNNATNLFNSNNIKILLGGLCPDIYIIRGTYKSGNKSSTKYIDSNNARSTIEMNKRIEEISKELPNSIYVSSEPLPHKQYFPSFDRYLEGDAEMKNGTLQKSNWGNVHYSADSLREFGQRYYMYFSILLYG